MPFMKAGISPLKSKIWPTANPDFLEVYRDIFLLNKIQMLLFSKQQGFGNPISLLSNLEHEKVK
jgi:hypothetical protein